MNLQTEHRASFLYSDPIIWIETLRIKIKGAKIEKKKSYRAPGPIMEHNAREAPL
jgi:hypothetical protein